MMFSEIEAAGPDWFYDQPTQTMIAYQTTDSQDGWTKAGTWMTYNDANSAKAIAEYACKPIRTLSSVFHKFCAIVNPTSFRHTGLFASH